LNILNIQNKASISANAVPFRPLMLCMYFLVVC